MKKSVVMIVGCCSLSGCDIFDTEDIAFPPPEYREFPTARDFPLK